MSASGGQFTTALKLTDPSYKNTSQRSYTARHRDHSQIHIVGHGQVQSEGTRLQRDEHDFGVTAALTVTLARHRYDIVVEVSIRRRGPPFRLLRRFRFALALLLAPASRVGVGVVDEVIVVALVGGHDKVTIFILVVRCEIHNAL